MHGWSACWQEDTTRGADSRVAVVPNRSRNMPSPDMPFVVTHSPAETEALGESWGRTAEFGLVLALSGDLGAGKTQLVKGLARGLGIPARVHSPTFTLVNEYTGGRLTLFHLDLYRLETTEQIHEAGLDEYLQPEGVAVIEWAERWPEGRRPKAEVRNLKSMLRCVQIEVLSETERRISYEDFGA
jgi:tRNA threonylcarbamoyladenosine biosynthesis protein TsaE